MKNIIASFAIIILLASCGNNGNSNNTSNTPGGDGGTTPSITSGNTDARQGQVIPTDSVETSKDSTGNIHPADTTKKK